MDRRTRALQEDYRQADLSLLDRVICDFAVDLTLDPVKIDASRVEVVTEAGVDPTMLHDIVQVTSLFNYYNRIAEGTGVDLEPEWSDDRSDTGS